MNSCSLQSFVISLCHSAPGPQGPPRRSQSESGFFFRAPTIRHGCTPPPLLTGTWAVSTFWPFPVALPPTPEHDLRFKPVSFLLGITPRRGPVGPLVVPRLTCSGTKRTAAPFYIPKGVCVLFFKGWLGASLGGHQPWGRGPVTCRYLADDREWWLAGSALDLNSGVTTQAVCP